MVGAWLIRLPYFLLLTCAYIGALLFYGGGVALLILAVFWAMAMISP
jgi:hypothetical protein